MHSFVSANSATMQRNDSPLVLLIVGPECNGKTSVLRRWIANEFDEEEECTTFDVVGLQVGSIKTVVQEIGGHESCSFRSVWRNVRKVLHGLVILYDMCYDKVDFELLKFYHDQVRRAMTRGRRRSSQPLPCVVLASHLDEKDRRATTTAQGREFAERLGALYFEVSAKTGEGVNEALDCAVLFFHSHRLLHARRRRLR